MDSNFIFGIIAFTALVLVLAVIILFAKSKLVDSGDITISINNDPEKGITLPAGGKLLGALASKGIFVSSACGGGGSCGQCKVQVKSGGGEILPTELSHISKKEAKEGWRLACQVNVKSSMDVELPEEIFGVKNGNVPLSQTITKQPSSKSLNFKFLKAKKYRSVRVVISKLKLNLIPFIIKTSIFQKSTTKTGINLTYGVILQKWTSILFVHTQWLHIRKRKALLCLTCVLLHLHHAIRTYRRVKCLPTFGH